VDRLAQRLYAEVRLKRIGEGLIPLRRSAGVGLLIDRLQPPDTFLVHGTASVLLLRGHLSDAVNRCFEKLLVGQQHEVKNDRRFALRLLVERRWLDRVQTELHTHQQLEI
jgi:hypothetical protein